MVTIPQEFIRPLIDLLEWHLSEYPRNPKMPDTSFIRLKRLQENLCSHYLEINDETLYYLKEAVYDARENIRECGIDAEMFSEIDEWIKNNRKS